jgi:hypothetical protein
MPVPPHPLAPYRGQRLPHDDLLATLGNDQEKKVQTTNAQLSKL